MLKHASLFSQLVDLIDRKKLWEEMETLSSGETKKGWDKRIYRADLSASAYGCLTSPPGFYRQC